MAQNIVLDINFFAIFINFLCHITVFTGGLYIAIHSRSIPNWLRTCLWYIGCSSFLIAITIILGWVLGPNFELSYDRIGMFGETLFNIWISITTITFFIKTIAADIKYSRSRVQKSP